ncbi:uncharacterized protein V1510DRAFT_377233 [Dipodascopsis tothii]|uniref:uncharacterized protein n=1 Tax=Dipodascopsis tothii TaxID=44089 RepID=UPI0034CF8DED
MYHRSKSPSRPVNRSSAGFPSKVIATSSESHLYSKTSHTHQGNRAEEDSGEEKVRPDYKNRTARSNLLQTATSVACVMVPAVIVLYVLSLFLAGGSAVRQDSWNLQDSSCPDYKTYSTRRHPPFTKGVLRLPYQRPVEECRTFHSTRVEEVIGEFVARIEDPDLARLFENCFPNTLDTTIRWHDSGREPRTFVVTGDINAEWIRDSTNQLSPYIPLIKSEKGTALKTLVLGAINTQAEYLIESPYCNAFQPPKASRLRPSSNDQNDVVHPVYDPATVFECKWELDSLASFLSLANQYYEATGDASFVGGKYMDALKNLLRVLDEQSLATYDHDGTDLRSLYTFQRQTNLGTETLSLAGAGNPTNVNTSLIRSAFRPSDDATIFQYFIPANAFIAAELKRSHALLAAAGHKDLASELLGRGEAIEAGVWEYGVHEHRDFGKVFAYEVDGYGGLINMDDANMPSLLGLPLLGFVDQTNEIYQNTRRMVMTKQGNPYFLKGPAFAGIGGPHIGIKHAWPMSLIILMRTSDNDQEIQTALNLVKRSTGGLGLMHESVNVRQINDYTRSWFAWCNAEFAKTIMDLAQRKPHLVFGEKGESYSV